MLRMTIDQIVAATGAEVLVPGGRAVAGAACIDSRAVEKDALFVAFAGERADGNAYLAGSARAGAACVVATAEPPAEALAAARETGCALVRAEADDGEEFLLRLAGAWRAAHPDWVVVAVTGSVGKTTTKEMLAAAIGARRRCHATAGNHNNLIGLPLTVLSAPEDAEVLVCELGMNHAGEIARLSRACAPTLACVTNVGTSHIGLLGSRENIARAKAEIVSGMRAHGDLGPALALDSADDFTPLIAEDFARPAGVEVVYVGGRAADAVRAESVELDAEGRAEVRLACSDGWRGAVRLPMPGRAAARDLMLALAIVWRLGLDRDSALEAVAGMGGGRMRLEMLDAPCGARVIDDSYNAAPASMASSLDVLASLPCSGRRVAVLGEMGELGDEAPRLHGYVGSYAAARADLLVTVGGSLADEIAGAARTMGMAATSVRRCATVGEAVSSLAGELGPGDVVLAKASRAAGLDQFVREVMGK